MPELSIRRAAALAALLLSLFVAYAATIAALVRDWLTDADASYGLAIAAVAAVVIVQRRRAFRAAISADASAVPGALLLVSGLLIYVTGMLAADLFLTRLSLVVVLAGTIALAAGARALRVVAAPIAFLAIAIPLPAIVVTELTLPLQLVASRIAELTLTAGGVPVFRDGNLLTLPGATLEVAEACSGMRSLISLVGIGALLAWFVEPRWWRRAVLVASAVPIAIVVNGFRIAATGAAVELWNPRAATGAFHEATGWVTFVISFAAMIAVSRALAHVSPSRRAPIQGVAAA